MIKEAKSIDLFSFLEAREYLEALFLTLKKERRRYSHELFAGDLGFPKSSYPFQVLAGDRTLTESAAKRMVEAIPLRNLDRRYFLALVRHGAAKTSEERRDAFQQILELKADATKSEEDKGMLRYFARWYHPVIRELVSLPQFVADPKWIAQQLQPTIKVDEAAKSFDLLQQLRLIQFDTKAGRWRQTEQVIDSSEAVRQLGLLAYHQEMIQRAKDSVVRVPAEEREIEALTFSASAAEFQRIKEEIRLFTSKLIDHYTTGADDDRVVQLNLQLFPLSRPVSERKTT